MTNELYYLTAEEIRHYQYMLSNGYEHKIVELGNQTYIVFPLIDKSHIGVAWPSVTGKIDGVSIDSDTMFQPCMPLQNKLMRHLKGSTLRILVFPKYAN